MKTKLLVIPLFLLFSAFATAQDGSNLEYGKPSELKGLKTVWIDTMADPKSFEKIVGVLKKDLPQLEIVEESDDADIRLQFLGGYNSAIVSSTEVYGTRQVNRQKLATGTGMVWVDAKGEKKVPRVLLRFENQQETNAEKMPATKFAKAFVKIYKDANDLK